MQREDRGSFDIITVLLYILLVGVGLAAIYSATYKPDQAGFSFDLSTQYGKQILWIAVSIAVGASLFLIDVRFFQVFAYYFYFLFLVLLVLVLIFSREVNGARSWFEIGGFRLQPSEFAKFGTALAMASYLSNIDVNLDSTRNRVIAALIPIIPMALIVLQGDAGSALVFSSFAIVMYREGLPGIYLLIGVAAILVFILTIAFGPGVVAIACLFLVGIYIAFGYNDRKRIWAGIIVFVSVLAMSYSVGIAYDNLLEDYQRSRIEITLGLKEDTQGAGYNVHQSTIAIGSGGFSGKGFLEGTQTKGDFVPEQHTDFIFSTIGEEFGWIGSFVVIGLFAMLFLRFIVIAERQRNKFSRIYTYSVLGIMLFHFAINIGMTIKLAPVIGIPLPFLSYGGSSLISFTIMVFLVIRLDANRHNELDSLHM